MDATTHTGNIDGIYHLRNPKNTGASIQALPDAHWVLGCCPGGRYRLRPPCHRQRCALLMAKPVLHQGTVKRSLETERSR
jgi:hypothetical protein